MPLRLLPDMEALTITWLRAHSSLVALVGGRISTAIPSVPTFPLVRLSIVAGSELIPEWWDEALLQVEAWHDSDRAQASLVARTARAAVLEMPLGSHPRGVVTGARAGVPRWLPDPETDRPRFIFDAAIRAHPHP